MIRYSTNPNQFSSIKSAISAVLPVTTDSGWKDIVMEFAEILEMVWKAIPYGNAEACKSLRKAMLADITSYINHNPVKTAIMQRLIPAISHLSEEQKLQLMFSLADSPKFPLYKESDLHKMADNITDHREEINAITYAKDGKRICPYIPTIYHNDRDLIGTIQAQKAYICSFLLENSESEEERDWYIKNADTRISAVLDQLVQIARDIDGYEQGTYRPTMLEQGWFDSVLNIRSNIDRCQDKMNRYANGQASAEDFGLSESKSPISDNEQVMRVLHMLGWNKSNCPVVLSNLFYISDLRLIGINKQDGQIEVEGQLYFAPAPGLGPGYKVRWVYSVDSNVNNYLTPLANLIQSADKKCDLNQAYNDQLTYLLNYLPMTVDAFCTDSTGYSDYLWVGIYRYLMQLYKMDSAVIDTVMDCFRLPVKIGNELINVEFGTFQGCKLLVFIMNHANRLMGIIADRLSTRRQACIRPNAGDDVVKIALEHKFDLTDILTEILVFAVFNCPTNLSKSAWLDRDEYFDFCSKYFARIEGSIKCVSGVPAKKYGKEIVCIADWSETYKVLHNSGQQHTNCWLAFQLARPFIEEELKQGCKLPNIYNIPMNVEMKVSEAQSIPFTYGGLAEADRPQDLARLIDILKYKASLLLSSYVFEPKGVYLIASKLEDLAGTELLKAIGSINRQGIRTLVELIRKLAEPESMNIDDLEWAKECIAKFERNAINGQSISKTSSTYHRLERNRDVDLLFPLGEIKADIGMPLPKDHASAIVMVSILADQNYVDIDNMRRYVSYMQTVTEYPGIIVRYHGIGNTTYYAVRDPDNGKLIRIYGNDDTRYPDFEPLYRCKNKKVYDMVQMLRDCNASEYINMFYGVQENIIDRQVERMTERLIERQKERLTKAVIESILRNLLDNIQDR